MRKRFKVHEYSEVLFEPTNVKVALVAVESQQTGRINLAVPIDSQIGGRAKYFVDNDIKDYFETGLYGYRDLVNLLDFKFGDEFTGLQGLKDVYYHKLLFPKTDSDTGNSSDSFRTVEYLSDLIDQYLEEIVNKKIVVLAPVQFDSPAELELLLSKLYAYGFVKIRINGDFKELEIDFKWNDNEEVLVEVVIDEFSLEWNLESIARLNDSLRVAMEFGDNRLLVIDADIKEVLILH